VAFEALLAYGSTLMPTSLPSWHSCFCDCCWQCYYSCSVSLALLAAGAKRRAKVSLDRPELGRVHGLL
jgi:hypothetical protein